MSALTLSRNIMLEFLANSIGQEKEIKRILTGKEDTKWSLFTNDRPVCVEAQ